MAFSTAQRRELLAVTEGKRNQVITAAKEYMARTALTVADLAHRAGYSTTSLSKFLHGSYATVAGNDSAICSALTEFMDAHPIEVLTESNGKVYETENVRLITRSFNEALDSRGAYYFRGAPGSQKTFVLQNLIAELNRAEISKNGHGRRAFYVRCRVGISPSQLMKRVAESAGSIGAGDIDRILRNLRFDLGRRKALFVFDEAQHLSVDCLETVRELHDMPPHCGVLFAGSHQIEQTFSRLDMEQWHSRIRQGRELPGVSESEAAEIIRAELGEKANVNFLIKQSYATDLRKGREVKYISARTLFLAIKGIQDRKQKAVTA